MKKLLTSLLLVPTMATAQEWFLIQEAENGAIRLFAQRGSLSVAPNVHGIMVASGRFALIERGQRTEIVGATALEACPTGGGPLIIASETATRRYWWDQQGGRMFDYIGKVICAGVEEAQKRSAPAAPPTSAPTGVSV